MAAAADPTRPAPASLGSALEGQVRVIADKATNSLIVMSSGRDFLAIKDVIHALDQPRRQVFIEAMILEVQLNNDSTSAQRARRWPDERPARSWLGGVQTPNA